MTQKELEDKVNYLMDYIEICKLQSTYSHYHHLCMFSQMIELFAQKTPGVELEINDSGVYEGIEGVRRFFGQVGYGHKDTPPFPGFLALHMCVNPVIEISNDGTRAKGLYHSPGCLVREIEGRKVATWDYGKYVMEYAMEDGQWKILKLNFRLTFHTPYEGKGWVEQPEVVSMNFRPDFPPDRPTTYHMPYNPYRLNKFEPPPPEPYKD